VKLEEASYWDEDTLKSGMADAGVNKYQTGTVKKYLADLKKTLDVPAPAPQPGEPPLLPLYFSGRGVGDEWIFSFSLTFLFFFFFFLSFSFFFFFPSQKSGWDWDLPKGLAMILHNIFRARKPKVSFFSFLRSTPILFYFLFIY